MIDPLPETVFQPIKSQHSTSITIRSGETEMPSQSGERVFTSWKEIASFFGKGVRTVQRWERKFGLPISRPTAAKNVVLATESELRDWIRRASKHLAEDGHTEGHHEPDNHDLTLAAISERLKRLEDDTERLTRALSTFTDRMDRMAIDIDGSNARLKSPPAKPKTLAIRK